jgi:hypothetical protein
MPNAFSTPVQAQTSRVRPLVVAAAVLVSLVSACGDRGADLIPAPPFSPGGNTLDFRLSVDGKARALLIESGARIIVTALWYGAPSETALPRLPPASQAEVPLAQQVLTLDPVNQTIMLRGDPNPGWRMDDVAGGVVRVRVRLQPTASALPDVVACGEIDDKVKALQAMPTEAICGFSPQPE